MRFISAAILSIVASYVVLCLAVFLWVHQYRNITDMRFSEIEVILGQPKIIDGVRGVIDFNGIDGRETTEVRLTYSDYAFEELQEATQDSISRIGKPDFAYLFLIRNKKMLIQCRLPEPGKYNSLISILSGPLNCITYLSVLA
jgi:hypothetical protein